MSICTQNKNIRLKEKMIKYDKLKKIAEQGNLNFAQEDCQEKLQNMEWEIRKVYYKTKQLMA